MLTAAIPKNEKERLENLYTYKILDEKAAQGFNEILEIAAYVCNTTKSYISFIDRDRQWNLTSKGFEGNGSKRSESFCAHTILQDDVFEIFDASIEEHFKSSGYVTGDLKLRSYASVPLKTREGYNIGTICVFDGKPGKLSEEQKNILKLLAHRVVKELELRLELMEGKERERKLSELDQFKAKILSIIAHDLRSPFHSIKGIIDLFEKGALSEDKVAYMMQLLKLEATNTSNLLENLIEWAKSKFENYVIKKENLSLHPLIAETIDVYLPEADRKGINIEYQEGSDLKVYGEKEMIKLTIRNLLNNSIKFCKKGNTIQIKCTEQDNRVVLTLSDNGPGMSAEKLAQIRNEKNNSQELTYEPTHSGLGLFLVNEFLKLNDGEMTVDSELGKGSSFEIKLVMPS